MSSWSYNHICGPPGNHKTGAVGKVFPGAEMKIDNPGPNGDGEICMRGRHVFMGYLHDDRKTKETIDENGWLHSGDIGRMDSEGMSCGIMLKCTSLGKNAPEV